ncbi:hypothetical protein EVAR_78476_1 [Eumeta japonica]|uniref:Uncharacterized protein n=1 Tax=Eumeta variegata TaxID=151549 RepID=A0A4C1TYB5_EUMVA|nr:hypothetical protein EVAR_78476_1 [Eumeta japonica]
MIVSTLAFAAHILISSFKILKPVHQVLEYLVPLYRNVAAKSIKGPRIDFDTRHLKKGVCVVRDFERREKGGQIPEVLDDRRSVLGATLEAEDDDSFDSSLKESRLHSDPDSNSFHDESFRLGGRGLRGAVILELTQEVKQTSIGQRRP